MMKQPLGLILKAFAALTRRIRCYKATRISKSIGAQAQYKMCPGRLRLYAEQQVLTPSVKRKQYERFPLRIVKPLAPNNPIPNNSSKEMCPS